MSEQEARAAATCAGDVCNWRRVPGSESGLGVKFGRRRRSARAWSWRTGGAGATNRAAGGRVAERRALSAGGDVPKLEGQRAVAKVVYIQYRVRMVHSMSTTSCSA